MAAYEESMKLSAEELHDIPSKNEMEKYKYEGVTEYACFMWLQL